MMDRYSTREIVMDWTSQTGKSGPRRLGHNPSWIQASHVDTFTKSLYHLLWTWRQNQHTPDAADGQLKCAEELEDLLESFRSTKGPTE